MDVSRLTKCCQISGLVLSNFVPSTKIFRQLLRVVEDDVRVLVSARLDAEPELPHEEHLIAEVASTVSHCNEGFVTIYLAFK